MSVPKIGKNATSVSKLLFSTINLHFVTSNQKSTYGKLNLTLPFLSLSLYLFLKQYLFRLPTSRNTKKTQADQSMSHVFLLCLKKKTTRKPLKVAAANSIFSSVHIIGTACLDECFSFYLITIRDITFRESLSLL